METKVTKYDSKFVKVYFADNYYYLVHDDDMLTKREALDLANDYIQFGLEILEAAKELE